MLKSVADAPAELRVSIQEFWPESEWDNAASISFLESGWDAFAVDNTTDAAHPCGTVLGSVNGVRITAENSIGYFQLNACNFSSWPSERFFNARHNAGTAHMLWGQRGWLPWYFSAKKLGLA